MTIQRRQFLSVMIGAATLALFPGDARANAAPDAAHAEGVESMRRVGEAYLSQRPAEADRDRLRYLLQQDLQRSGITLCAEHSPAGVTRGFEDMIKADFAANRTIMLDGWVLSVTECRLCALQVIG